MSGPFQGSSRLREGGFPVTHLHDFKGHVNGAFYRHTADQIDMNPPLPQLGGSISATTIQTTLEKIGDFLESAGQGFVTIGDGYDASAQDNFVVGSLTTPTIEAAFTAAFAHPRLVNGGIILLKAGTYRVVNTIVVPAGICVMGELGGSVLVSQTAEKSMFQISYSRTYPAINTDGSISSGEPVDIVKFFNLTMIDNLDGYVQSGGQPIPTMITVPMIAVERGANFYCDQITFLGRLGTLGAGPAFGRDKTKNAVAVLGSGSGNRTNVVVKNCFFDGHKVPIEFYAGTNASLVVDKCRARTYGSDTPLGTAADNCFVTFSVADADVKCTNNYHFGAGKTVFASYVDNGSTNSIITLLGNSGSPSPVDGSFPSSGLTTEFFVTTSITSITVVDNGNYWGTLVDNNWVVSIGDGTNSIGDVTGPRALDTLFNLYAGHPDDKGVVTVIVNSGHYVVAGASSGNNYRNFKIIGNKLGATYPTLRLAVTNVSTDYLGNKFIALGNLIRSIEFVSLGSYHSVLVGAYDSAGATQSNLNTGVEDCVFVDTSLVFEKLVIVSDVFGNVFRSGCYVEYCQFLSTATFADNLALLMPSSNLTRISDTIISGNGYGLAIGNFGAYSSTSFNNPRVLLENMTLNPTTVTANSPLGSANNRYLTIQTPSSFVTINNVTITSPNTPVNVALNTTFTKMCDIDCTELYINNCRCVGPNQTFNSGGTDYAMPMLFAGASRKLSLTDSSFSGKLPVQLSSAILLSSDTNDGLFVKDCAFSGSNLTLLDIDFDHVSAPTPTTKFPHIVLERNSFFQALSIVPSPVLHFNNTSAFYDTAGVVQIYAGQTRVHFDDNKVRGNVAEIPGGAVNYAGVYINTRNLDTFSGSNDGYIGEAFVANNDIKIESSYDTAALRISASLYLVGALSQVHDNILFMNNTGVVNLYPLTNMAGCLYIEQHETTLGSYSQNIVSGNMFSRRNESGQAASSIAPNKLSTVVIANSGSGLLTDNVFSDQIVSVDGSGEPQVVVPDTWVVDRNINYLRTVALRTVNGRHNLHTTSSANFVLDGIDPTPVTDGVIYSDQTFSSVGALTWVVDTAVLSRYSWTIPLQEVLPIGCLITSVTCNVGTSPLAVIPGAAGQNIITMQIDNAAFAGTSTVDFKVAVSGTLTLTPDQRVMPDGSNEMPQLRLSGDFINAGAPSVLIGDVTIIYTW